MLWFYGRTDIQYILLVPFWPTSCWRNGFRNWGCWDVWLVLWDQLLLSSMHHKSTLQILSKKYGNWPLNQVGFLSHVLFYSYIEFLSSLWLMFSIIFFPTAFISYVVASVSVVLALVLHFEPRYGQTNLLVYMGICSLMGSLTVIIFVSIVYMEVSYRCLMNELTVS